MSASLSGWIAVKTPTSSRRRGVSGSLKMSNAVGNAVLPAGGDSANNVEQYRAGRLVAATLRTQAHVRHVCVKMCVWLGG